MSLGSNSPPPPEVTAAPPSDSPADRATAPPRTGTGQTGWRRFGRILSEGGCVKLRNPQTMPACVLQLPLRRSDSQQEGRLIMCRQTIESVNSCQTETPQHQLDALKSSSYLIIHITNSRANLISNHE